jgi:HlyD family secretion protein
MKKVLVPAAVLVVAAAGFWLFTRGNDAGGGYRFVQIDRGNIESVVSSTGTIDAVTTVEVGTQVSGIVSTIYVDFNDSVKKGQVIARLDTTLLAIQVREAKANVELADAQLRRAERDYARAEALYKENAIADTDYSEAQYGIEAAKASAKLAKIRLEQARRNLAYATIYAPISGKVIERDVDVGQTVAASLSAPKLFLIANDLSHMQILVGVDESDIGRIKEGQKARFTVQAYADKTFRGTVRQVRLQSTTQDNVVNYTVVVDVENKDGLLLPGMTATVDFLVETATDVLRVPTAALRFRPTEEMLARLRERREAERGNSGAPPDSVGRVERAGTGGAPGRMDGSTSAGGQRHGNVSFLYYIDAKGELAATPVRTGITDGQMTEIRGRNVEAGMMVIAGVTNVAQTTASNPFQGQQSRPRGRPGPGF